MSQALEPLKTSLPQDTATQTAFANLSEEIQALIVMTAKFALENLLELKESLLLVLPAYIDLEDKLEIAIEAAQRALGVDVTPASKYGILNDFVFL